MRSYFLDVGGARLRVWDTRDTYDGLPLVIFNGIGASLEVLEPFVQRLRVATLVFDLPGVGGSPPYLMLARMRFFSALARRALDAAGVDRAHMMGVSWGGALAQDFAYRHPERTERLILAATSTGQISVPPNLSVMLHMAVPHRYLSPRYFRSIAGRIYGGDFRRNSAVVREHVARMTPPTMLGYLQQLIAIAGWTSIGWLGQLSMPTLVMAGADDPIIPLVNGRYLARRLPDAVLEVFDCGHLFLLTRGERSQRVVEDFLAPSPASVRRQS